MGGAGPHLPQPPVPLAKVTHRPLRARPSRGDPEGSAAPLPSRVTSMAGPAGCRGGEIAAPQPLPAPLHPPRAASASVIPARRAGRARAVRHGAPPRGTGGAVQGRCPGGRGRGLGRAVAAGVVFSALENGESGEGTAATRVHPAVPCF